MASSERFSLLPHTLNARFGLYELPSVRLSGVYDPKSSLFGKLGFSPTEAALMKKEFKSVTRRHELTFIFIFPISMLVLIFFSALRSSQAGSPLPVGGHYLLFALMTLIPGLMITPFLGTLLTSLEGTSVWYLFSAPISAKSIARIKFFFVAFFALSITFVCSIIGGLVFRPRRCFLAVTLLVAGCWMFSMSAISVALGSKHR
jgi:hypothetical protein